MLNVEKPAFSASEMGRAQGGMTSGDCETDSLLTME